MINKFLAAATTAVLTLGMTGTASEAAPINPADYGFTVPGTKLLDNEPGFTTFIGLGLGDFWGGEASGLFFNTFPSDPTNAFLSYNLLPQVLDSSNSAIYANVMPDIAQFFFDLNTGNNGYLFTIDASGQLIDFTDPFGEFDTDVQLSLEEFAVIPLPASFLLMISGLGGLLVVGRRKQRVL